MMAKRNVMLGMAVLMWGTAGVPSPLLAQRDGERTSATTRSIAADTMARAEPGDVIRLRIWREADMSGDYTIDATGHVTLPRLGATLVTSLSPDSLQQMLVAEYARYLKNPSVEVLLLRRVRVMGAVRTPGLYTADQTMRVRDVLALAGGATSEGRTDIVRLQRDGHSTSLSLTSAARTNEVVLRSGDQLYVPERSWFARNTPLLAAIVSVSGGLLFAFATR